MRRILLIVSCLAFLSSSCGTLLQTPGAKIPAQYSGTYKIGVVCSDGKAYTGTGFAVSDRQIITARHVVECDGDAKPVVIGVMSANDEKMTEVVEDAFPKSDAVDAVRLVVAGSGHPFTPLPVRTTRPKRGDVVCSIGANYQNMPMRKCGYVGLVTDDFAGVSVHCVPGNSGGPVFDSEGYVVGIVVRGRWDSDSEFVMLMQLSASWEDLIDKTAWVDMAE